MKSILLLIFAAVFVNCSKDNEDCKESYFNPVPNIDVKKLSGRWNVYKRYNNIFQENNTCAFCEITYKPCKDKYQLVSNNFDGDVALPKRSAWVEQIGKNGIFNLDWDGVGFPKLFVTYVDYDKLALLRACYNGESKSFILRNFVDFNYFKFRHCNVSHKRYKSRR